MKVALCGLGKAGSQIFRYIAMHEDLDLVIAFCRNGSKKAGKSIAEISPYRTVDAPIYEVDKAEEALLTHQPDVLIDFSNKAATLSLLPVCARLGVNMVICTTNFSPDELESIQETAKNAAGFALVYAPNITLGVNVLMMLCEQTAKAVPDFDFAITEKHHHKKEDVSATAKKIAATLEGAMGKPVPVSSIRVGGYVGLHEVMAVSEFERITLIHESFSRQAFAEGAFIAARYCAGKSGYFEMRDVINAYLYNN